MTKHNQNFEITAGDALNVVIAVDMTSSTLVGSSVKWAAIKYDEPILTKTTTGDISITGPKEITLAMNAADTLALTPGQYKHQAEVTDLTGKPRTIEDGVMTVLENLV